ncbi:hypothetical protein HY256_12140 [Candidatus Sumerlaeota bacterium]|nr:hypothetical protein [Candidatus Sumerlaeota bacterium]
MTRAALDLVEADPTRLILMAAKASRPETEYGWIELSNPGPENNGQDENSLSVGQVTAFYEKPDLQTAQRLQRRGCFWSTMIVVAKAKTLWRLGWQFQPALMDAMDFIRRVAISVTHGRVCADHVRLAIAHAYRNIGAEDFSSVLLNRAATSSLAVPLEDIEWNDWGQPERIVETVQHGFYRATFPLGSARSPLNAMEAGGQNAAHPHQR